MKKTRTKILSLALTLSLVLVALSSLFVAVTQSLPVFATNEVIERLRVYSEDDLKSLYENSNTYNISSITPTNEFAYNENTKNSDLYLDTYYNHVFNMRTKNNNEVSNALPQLTF